MTTPHDLALDNVEPGALEWCYIYFCVWFGRGGSGTGSEARGRHVAWERDGRAKLERTAKHTSLSAHLAHLAGWQGPTPMPTPHSKNDFKKSFDKVSVLGGNNIR